MTDTAAAELNASTEIPDAIGFGFAELIALLNIRRGEAATLSAKALRISNELDETMVVAAGAASLVAHEFASVGAENELVVAGPVAAVCEVLTSATKRVEVALISAEQIDYVIFFESADFRILMQPRAYLTWYAMAQRPDVDSAESTLFLVKKHLEQYPDGGVTIRLLESPELGTLLVKGQPGHWTTAISRDAGNELSDQRESVDDATLLQLLVAVRGG